MAALIALNWQYPGAREARLAKPCDLQKSVDELRKASAAAFFVRPRCRNVGPRITLLNLHSSELQLHFTYLNAILFFTDRTIVYVGTIFRLCSFYVTNRK